MLAVSAVESKTCGPDWCVPHNLRLVEKRQVMVWLSLVWFWKLSKKLPRFLDVVWMKSIYAEPASLDVFMSNYKASEDFNLLPQDMLDSWKSNVANQLTSQCQFARLQAVPPRAEPRRRGTSWDTPNCWARGTCRTRWQIWQSKIPHFVHFMPRGSLEVWEVGHVGLKRSLSSWFGGLGSVSMSAAPCAQLGEKYELRKLVAERFASSFGKSGEFTVIVEEASRNRNWSDSSAVSDGMKLLDFWDHWPDVFYWQFLATGPGLREVNFSPILPYTELFYWSVSKKWSFWQSTIHSPCKYSACFLRRWSSRWVELTSGRIPGVFVDFVLLVWSLRQDDERRLHRRKKEGGCYQGSPRQGSWSLLAFFLCGYLGYQPNGCDCWGSGSGRQVSSARITQLVQRDHTTRDHTTECLDSFPECRWISPARWTSRLQEFAVGQGKGGFGTAAICERRASWRGVEFWASLHFGQRSVFIACQVERSWRRPEEYWADSRACKYGKRPTQSHRAIRAGWWKSLPAQNSEVDPKQGRKDGGCTWLTSPSFWRVPRGTPEARGECSSAKSYGGMHWFLEFWMGSRRRKEPSNVGSQLSNGLGASTPYHVKVARIAMQLGLQPKRCPRSLPSWCRYLGWMETLEVCPLLDRYIFDWVGGGPCRDMVWRRCALGTNLLFGRQRNHQGDDHRCLSLWLHGTSS